MAKTIIKEIGIALLLLIAIALLLGVLLYDYIPNNKTVPIKIQAYEMPEDIKNELQEAIPEGQNIVRTYYIDSTDLNSYEATNDYDKGKPNPFAEYVPVIQDNSNNSTDSNNNNTNNNKNDSATSNNTLNNEQSSTNQNEVYITTPGKNY